MRIGELPEVTTLDDAMDLPIGPVTVIPERPGTPKRSTLATLRAWLAGHLYQSGTWTPTVSGEDNCTAPSHSIGYWQRVGDYYELHCLFTVTATVAGAVRWDFTWPPGFPAVTGFRSFVGDVVCLASRGESRVTRDSTKITARFDNLSTNVQNAWVWLRIWAGEEP